MEILVVEKGLGEKNGIKVLEDSSSSERGSLEFCILLGGIVLS